MATCLATTRSVMESEDAKCWLHACTNGLLISGGQLILLM